MAARRKPKLVRLKRPVADPDCEFIRSLVWALDQARAGKLLWYAAVFKVATEEHTRSIECADCVGEASRLETLGMIRKMEHNFIKREWED